MSTALDYEESLIDKLNASTEGGQNKNPLFRLSFMSYNLHGPQLVGEIRHGRIIENLLEDGSKTKALIHDMNEMGEHCLFACGSIDGQTLDKFLIRKMKIQQQGLPQQAQSAWSKWFGGNNDGKNTRDSSGFS